MLQNLTKMKSFVIVWAILVKILRCFLADNPGNLCYILRFFLFSFFDDTDFQFCLAECCRVSHLYAYSKFFYQCGACKQTRNIARYPRYIWNMFWIEPKQLRKSRNPSEWWKNKQCYMLEWLHQFLLTNWYIRFTLIFNMSCKLNKKSTITLLMN